MWITVACELNFGSGIVKRGVIVLQALSRTSCHIQLYTKGVCVCVCFWPFQMCCCCWCVVTQLNAPWSSVSWVWAVDYLYFNWRLVRISWETWHFHFHVGWVGYTTQRGEVFNGIAYEPKFVSACDWQPQSQWKRNGYMCPCIWPLHHLLLCLNIAQ